MRFRMALQFMLMADIMNCKVKLMYNNNNL